MFLLYVLYWHQKYLSILLSILFAQRSELLYRTDCLESKPRTKQTRVRAFWFYPLQQLQQMSSSSSSMAVDSRPTPAPKLVLDEFIGTALSATPSELHPFFESFKTLHTRKLVIFVSLYIFSVWLASSRLWHQLTLKLFEFFDHPLSKPFRVDVFERFVTDFESKLNQLRLVEMGVKVSKEIDSKCYLY